MSSGSEQIGFSSQLSTIYLEIIKLFSQKYRKDLGITLTDAEILLTLYQSDSALSFRQLADFLIMKISSIWQLTPSLEEREFIKIKNNERDKRLASISLSKQGDSLAKDCNEAFCLLKNVIQKTLPDSEYYTYLQTGIHTNLDILRGFEVDFCIHNELSAGYSVEFIVFARAIVEKWRQCIHDSCKLNLNEFRILHSLADVTTMRAQDLSEHLLTPRSQISACKKHLVNLSLIEEVKNPFDARSLIIGITKKGRAIVNDVIPKLDEITVPTHVPSSDESVLILKAWHSRMYYNLKTYSKNT